LMDKNMHRNVERGGSTLGDNSASSPSYESLMKKIMKLQEANSPVVKRVANVAVAAVHWKVQTKKKSPRNTGTSNWQKTDDEYDHVVAGGVLLEVEGNQELIL
jgi:hypothetical protein